MSRIVLYVVFVVPVLFGCAGPQPGTDRFAPTLCRTIVLEDVGAPRSDVGVPGRLDHFAYDSATERLFVAALENGSLEVLDLATGQRVKSIGGLGHPQGIAIAATVGCAVVACGDGLVHVYDTRTLEEKLTIDVGPGADNVRYDAPANAVYVTHGNTQGGAITVLDPNTWAKLREIPFKSRPESFQLALQGPRLFANLPEGIRATKDGIVAVADRNTAQLIAEIPLVGRAQNFPMALDPAHERLFTVTRRPARLIVIDTRRNTVLAETDCAEDSDDVFYDAQSNRVVVIAGGFRPDMQTPEDPKPTASTGEMGMLDVFAVADDGRPTRLAMTPTAPHARTGLFVPARRAVFVGVPPRAGRPAEIREYHVRD